MSDGENGKANAPADASVMPALEIVPPPQALAASKPAGKARKGPAAPVPVKPPYVPDAVMAPQATVVPAPDAPAPAAKQAAAEKAPAKAKAPKQAKAPVKAKPAPKAPKQAKAAPKAKAQAKPKAKGNGSGKPKAKAKAAKGSREPRPYPMPGTMKEKASRLYLKGLMPKAASEQLKGNHGTFGSWWGEFKRRLGPPAA